MEMLRTNLDTRKLNLVANTTFIYNGTFYLSDVKHYFPTEILKA